MTNEEMQELVETYTELYLAMSKSINVEFLTNEPIHPASVIRAILVLGLQGGIALLTEKDPSSREFFARILDGEEILSDSPPPTILS